MGKEEKVLMIIFQYSDEGKEAMWWSGLRYRNTPNKCGSSPFGLCAWPETFKPGIAEILPNRLEDRKIEFR